MDNNTIYALSSGSTPSGIAIIRVSGPNVRFALETMIGRIPQNRIASLTDIVSPNTKAVIDRGLVLFFEAPHSFTGEDCCEFQVHGGHAVVKAMLSALNKLEGFTAADPGEFSKRAFENGKLDLTEIEGLSDLIHAQTEKQRILALNHSQGQLRNVYENWRTRLIHIRALIEAELDFSDEEDVSDNINCGLKSDILNLSNSIEIFLNDGKRGEIIRDGFKIVLMGSPNSGKSSLLNALATRDVAIVSNYAGTTRDIIDVNLDVFGYHVIVSDTAGLRNTTNPVEIEGISRALERGNFADLVIWLDPSDQVNDDNRNLLILNHERIFNLRTKVDLDTGRNLRSFDGSVSVVTERGIDSLLEHIGEILGKDDFQTESILLSRQRHREILEKSLQRLSLIINDSQLDIEFISDNLRQASDQIGRLVGKIDVEDLLDQIFSEFCIGK